MGSNLVIIWTRRFIDNHELKLTLRLYDEHRDMVKYINLLMFNYQGIKLEIWDRKENLAFSLAHYMGIILI